VDDNMLTCAFCGSTVPDTESAINAGWEPNFWRSDTHFVPHPACGTCCREHLEFPDGSGDLIVKTGHERFIRIEQQQEAKP
jgi:hypothetical protein